jgi:GxxExxY protein
MEESELTGAVIGCSIEVHRELGPGLLESTYERCLAHEMEQRDIAFRVQAPIAVRYKEAVIDCGFRADLIVDDRLIVELKAVEDVRPIHEAQRLTYMKLAGIRTGLLINFNVRVLKNGIKRFRR